MEILSELIYEITHFNFMIWLLSGLTLVLFGLPLLFLIIGRVKGGEAPARLAGTGENASARVKEITPTGSVMDGSPEMAITLEVTSPMRGTFEVEKRVPVPVQLMSKMVRGAVLPVSVSGTMPDEVSFHFKRVGRVLGSFKSVLGMGAFVLFFWVLFGYIFAFSMKGTDSYNCAVQQALSDPRVTEALGDDVKPGFFVWLSSSTSGSGVSNSYYRLLLKGSKGIGNLYVATYSAPSISTMELEFEEDGKSVQLYSGSTPCR